MIARKNLKGGLVNDPAKNNFDLTNPADHQLLERLKQTISSSGLWRGELKKNHEFVLSPDVYLITEEQRQKLEKLGRAVHQCLSGIGRIMAIASQPPLAHGQTWGMIRRALQNGVPDYYQIIQNHQPGATPGICKVDLMLSDNNSYYIAEIDGHNKHGLGYSTLAAQLREDAMPKAKTLPGTAVCLVKEFNRLKPKNQNLILIYADQERFYLPEFIILQERLNKLGVNLMVVNETEIEIKNNELMIRGNPISDQIFIDLPFIYKNPELKIWLQNKYLAQIIKFIIPPKPFLGAKALLAFLRNDEHNSALEGILNSQIPEEYLSFIRQHIPETYLVHPREKTEYWKRLMRNRAFVLKESVSSGMKGVIFSDNKDFDSLLQQANRSYFRFILQQEIVNQAQKFQFYDSCDNLRDANWYMRITVHYALHLYPTIADIVVTARQDKRVHGAIDCLQLGTAII